MKKVLLSAAAVMFALAAFAQNKAIDALAKKYAEVEGFTVVNLDGEALKSMGAMIPQGDATITLDDGSKLEPGELLNGIVSVTAIINKGENATFAYETTLATNGQGYSTVVAHNQDGIAVRILSKDIKRGKLKGNKEIVVTVVAGEIVAVGRMIGNIDTELLAKLAAEAQKRS